MSYEHLWQNEAWRKAFQRWWDEDWSWEGLGKKNRNATLGDAVNDSFGILQDVWQEEKNRLIEFGGRRWTRFHLPPFDCEGNRVSVDIWREHKGTACLVELEKRLDAAKAPALATVEKEGLRVVAEFAELRGIVYPSYFAYGGATLVADLRSAIFVRAVMLSKRVLARFNSAIFSQYAQFRDTTFSGDAWFDGATFCGDAWFNSTTFSRNARFVDVTFSGSARFADAMFASSARFDGATFSGDAWFNHATFSRNVWFGGVTFSGGAWFIDATFSGDAWFNRTTFSGPAWFCGTMPLAKGAAFPSAQFRGVADFSGRAFNERTNFSRTRFYGVTKFHGAKLHPDTSFLNARFPGEGRALPPLWLKWFHSEDDTSSDDKKQVRTATRERFARWKRWRWRIGPREWRSRPWKAARFGGIPFALRWDPKLRAVRKAHDSDAEEYEIAYRQLRRLCAEIGSIEYESRFHALELKAHRARTDTQMPARIASWLYEKLSDYGRSLSRPLWWLAGSWGVVTLAYRLLFTPPYHADAMGLSAGTCESMGGTPAWNEILVTAGREFLPSLFGMSNTVNRPEWLRCAEGGHPLLFFFVSAFQIVVFLTCISLFLIALRRRFQLRD